MTTKKPKPNAKPAAAKKKAAPIKHPTEQVKDPRPKICERLAAGESLRAICRTPGMPCAATVLSWARDDAEGFGKQYTRARELGYAHLAEEILEISDEEVTYIKPSKHRAPNAGKDDPDEEATLEVAFDPTAVARNRLRVDSRKFTLR